MKIKKIISEKVVNANRANAKKSTGAKTVPGKQNSRRNAFKHGIFAAELHIREGEQSEFERLRRDIASQLLPQTALQKLALDEIVSCTWRVKLATRLETGLLRANLDGRVSQQKENEVSRDAAIAGWYAANRANLQAGIQFLARLRDDVKTNGRVREFLKDELVSGFGMDFYDELNTWLPVNIDVIGFTDQMLHHSENYKLPLPDEKPRVVVDIRARLQMVLKLIDQEVRHLQDLQQSFERRVALSGDGATNFAPRFFTATTRDLHRAVDWYARLKDQRM